MELGERLLYNDYFIRFLEWEIRRGKINTTIYLTNNQLKSNYRRVLLRQITEDLYFQVQSQTNIVRSSIERQILIIKK